MHIYVYTTHACVSNLYLTFKLNSCVLNFKKKKTFHVCIMDNRLLDWLVYILRRNYIIVYKEQLALGFFLISKKVLCCSKFVSNNKGFFEGFGIFHWLLYTFSAACPWLFIPKQFFFWKYNRVPTEKKNYFSKSR